MANGIHMQYVNRTVKLYLKNHPNPPKIEIVGIYPKSAQSNIRRKMFGIHRLMSILLVFWQKIKNRIG